MGNCCSAGAQPTLLSQQYNAQTSIQTTTQPGQQQQNTSSTPDVSQDHQQGSSDRKSGQPTLHTDNEPIAHTKILVQVDEPAKETFPVTPKKDVSANSLLGYAPVPEPPIAVESRRVEDRYEVGRELGRGCFGIVRVCKEKSTGKEWAIKYVTKSAVKSYTIVQDEIRQLQKVGQHPNVVQLHDFFADGNGFYIVMEYCRGGDLFTRIVSEGSYSEAKAAELLRQLASAIQHMHNNKIAHRDLKPENLLLMTKSPDSPLKVVDFGLSKFVNSPQGVMSTVIGTWAYCAPEVFSRKPYTEKVDNWALGVLMFIMLSGYHPFDVYGDSTEPMLIDNICKGRFDFTEPEWQNISQDAKHIIAQLLRSDPNSRMSIEAFLSTDWVSGKSASASLLDQSQKRLQLRLSVQH